jgi:hypothetical protein
MGTTDAAPEDQGAPGRYEIRLQAHLEDRWASWFDGLTLTRDADGTTLLAGPVVDQAALHGLLRRVRDLGLPLIAVSQVEPMQTSRPDDTTDTEHTHLHKETDR